mgnify:CR=1 FL=1
MASGALSFCGSQPAQNTASAREGGAVGGEEKEVDVKVWEVVGGRRRGGRRVSKRISELLDIFDPEGGARTSMENNLEFDCARDIPNQHTISSLENGRATKSTIGGFKRNIVTGSTEGASTSSSKSRKFYKLTKTF